jgi:hypothetical protein
MYTFDTYIRTYIQNKQTHSDTETLTHTCTPAHIHEQRTGLLILVTQD